MGGSSKPLMRYTTSDMAKDLIELLDHLGWTGERELHVSGVSMGGMIAQELGLLIPNRICSLNLLSTAAKIENTTSFIENLRTRINMFIPKSLDRSVADAADSLFSNEWLDKPDDSPLPTPKTPLAVMPPSGHYSNWATNYQRFAAVEINKRSDAGMLPSPPLTPNLSIPSFLVHPACPYFTVRNGS
jgi:pimeloyl-ACP methyl ester carboxylesterase